MNSNTPQAGPFKVKYQTKEDGKFIIREFKAYSLHDGIQLAKQYVALYSYNSLGIFITASDKTVISAQLPFISDDGSKVYRVKRKGQ